MIFIIFQILIYILACLFLFIIMYDHCVHKKTIVQSLKERALQFALNPLLWYILRAVLTIGIIYLIYSLLHGSTLF